MGLVIKDIQICVVVLFTVISTRSYSKTAQIDGDQQALQAEVDSLNQRAGGYRYTSIDSLGLFAEKAYLLSTKLGYIPGLVEATRLKTTSLAIKGKYTEAISLLFDKKLEIENTSYDKEKAIIDYYLGIAYSISRNFRASLPYLNQSLERFRELEDKEYIKQCLVNIGVCYMRLEQFDKALEIFKQIKNGYKGLSPGYNTTLMVNFAFCYYGLGEYSKAKDVINDFFAIPKDSVDERGYGFAYLKLGQIYSKEGNFSKGVNAFNSCIEVFQKFKSQTDQIEPLNGLALLYLSQGDYDKANMYAQRAKELALESSILAMQKDVLGTIYKILKAQGKYKEALQTQEEFQIISDSLVLTQQSAEVGRLSAQYDFNQQKNELLLKQKEKELESQRLVNSQELTINITITIIVAIVVLLLFIYREYALKARRNKLLTEKNREIELQRDQLEQTNRVKNKLFSIISHDLRSPIQTLDGLLYLVRNKVANNEDLESVLPKLISSFDHASDLLNNLLSWATSQMEGYTLEFKDFNIMDVLGRVLENSKLRLEEKAITAFIEGEDQYVHGEENMIQIVCQNLLGNAIKYCKSGDEIRLKIHVDDSICVKIIDTGEGMSAKQLDMLLNKNTFSSTDGTDNEKGSGLGLLICKDLLKKNNSELEIESTEGKGSTFSFCLPKAT